MRKLLATSCLAALAVLAPVAPAAADEIRLISVGGVKTGLELIIADFMKATGHKVIYTPGNPVQLPKRILNEPFDVVVQSDEAMDEGEKAGALKAGTRKAVVRGGIGMAVNPNAPAPDISTPDGFKAALMKAKAIGIGDATNAHGSGRVVQRVLMATGIHDAIKDKLKVVGLEPGLKMVLAGQLDLGLVNASEVWSYVKYAGPVPGPLQHYTNYEVAVTAKAATPDAAALAAAIAAGAAHWNTARMEPSAK